MWTDSKEELEMSRFYPPENRAQLGGSEQEHHRHGSFLEKDACGYCREVGLDKKEPERVRVHTHQGSKTHY